MRPSPLRVGVDGEGVRELSGAYFHGEHAVAYAAVEAFAEFAVVASQLNQGLPFEGAPAGDTGAVNMRIMLFDSGLMASSMSTARSRMASSAYISA